MVSTRHSTHIKVRGQLSRAVSLRLFGSQAYNTGCQALWQVPLPTGVTALVPIWCFLELTKTISAFLKWRVCRHSVCVVGAWTQDFNMLGKCSTPELDVLPFVLHPHPQGLIMKCRLILDLSSDFPNAEVTGVCHHFCFGFMSLTCLFYLFRDRISLCILGCPGIKFSL